MQNKQGMTLGLMTLALASCGGGGGSSSSGPTGPQTATGYFADAKVAGMTYSSGSMSGVTDGDGRFSYIPGQPVTFSVGNVVLGTVTAGQPLVTPTDLTTASATTDAKVTNRVRFLMMLDSDGNPDNGITISKNTILAASHWPAIDFDAASLSIPSTVQQDVAIADGRLVSLPDATAATSHFNKTLICAYSGAYVGTAIGEFLNDSVGQALSPHSNFGMLVSALDGSIQGLVMKPTGAAGSFPLTGNVTFTNKIPLVTIKVARTLDTVTFNGGLPTPDSFNGNGGFVDKLQAKRIGGSPAALYRFTGRYHGNGDSDDGVFTFDIDNDRNITGIAYSIVTGTTTPLSGTLSNLNRIQATADSTRIGGVVNSDYTVTGNWVTGPQDAGSFAGDGCQLNPVPQ